MREDRSTPALEGVFEATTGDARARGAKNATRALRIRIISKGTVRLIYGTKSLERSSRITVAVRSGDTAFDTDTTRCAVASGVADDFGNNQPPSPGAGHAHSRSHERRSVRESSRHVDVGSQSSRRGALRARSRFQRARCDRAPSPRPSPRRTSPDGDGTVVDDVCCYHYVPGARIERYRARSPERHSRNARRRRPAAKKMMPAPTERERSTRERGVDARAR